MTSYVLQNAVGKKRDYSFSLDLREYDFPSDWSGAVEVKIVQHNVYCHKITNKVGEVESPILKMQVSFADRTAGEAAVNNVAH